MFKKPSHYYSWTTLTGTVIAAISFFLILFLFIISLFSKGENQYTALLIYIILPAFMILGLLLIPTGIILKRKKEKKAGIEKSHRFPIVNLNDPKQRWIVIFVTLTTSVLFVMSVFGSYKAYHYTESNEFCGLLCHKVMSPEYTTYHTSEHARVKCVECHIGSGAGWYLKSKLSGMYQVYSALFDKYPRPIPTPLHNLRPASETCANCHWPEKFFDRKYITCKHYLADETTTAWNVHLLMKICTENGPEGEEKGVHWHNNRNVKIQFASLKNQRDTILWVRYTNLKSGKSIVYTDDSIPFTKKQMNTLSVRTMDCLDCHNRPAHKFNSPVNYFDEALTKGQIAKLPDIKIAAMDILDGEVKYPTLDSAFKAIETGINEYYEIMYEAIYANKKYLIDSAVASLKKAYAANTFPAMKTDWETHPDYLGHTETNGCHRCHNDRFKSSGGEVISRKCTLCHLIKAQGIPGKMVYADSSEALEFVHPVGIKGKWKKILCAKCHRHLYE